MPLVRYTWQHPEGHELTEEGLYEFTNDVRALLLETEPALKHPEAKLLGVEIINPLVHEHSWRKTSKMGERVYYECSHCQIIGWRKFSNFYGAYGNYYREDKWKSVKFETCRSPLKEMPASTSLFK